MVWYATLYKVMVDHGMVRNIMQHCSTAAKAWPLYSVHDVTKMADSNFVCYSFAFNTRYKHFHNLKLLYSGYLNQIFLYKQYFFLLPMFLSDWSCLCPDCDGVFQQ